MPLSDTTVELTKELIDAAFPLPVADDPTAMALASTEEIHASLDRTLVRHDPGADLWVFGYGSLMWRPELAFVEQRIGELGGWQRSFCLWQWRFRGTRQRPGLMLALDEGGGCGGVLYRLPASNHREQLLSLWKREMTGRGYVADWADVTSSGGGVRAVTFFANRAGPRYAGRLATETVADHIASACGHAGPNATYLLETWRYCLKAGIADAYIETLQGLVALRLARRGRSASA